MSAAERADRDVCPACEGSGRFVAGDFDEPCQNCDATGRTPADILPPRGEKHTWASFALLDGLRVCSAEDPDDEGSILATAAGFCVCWDDGATDDVQRRDDGAWVTDYGVELALVEG